MLAPRILNDVSYVRRINHEIHVAWQAQYLVTPVALRIVNDVAYVTRINHYSHFAWQVQYLVKLEDDSCCSAHCMSGKTVINRSNHCLERLSPKTTEVMAVLKDCHHRLLK